MVKDHLKNDKLSKTRIASFSCPRKLSSSNPFVRQPEDQNIFATLSKIGCSNQRCQHLKDINQICIFLIDLSTYILLAAESPNNLSEFAQIIWSYQRGIIQKRTIDYSRRQTLFYSHPTHGGPITRRSLRYTTDILLTTTSTASY